MENPLPGGKKKTSPWWKTPSLVEKRKPVVEKKNVVEKKKSVVGEREKNPWLKR